ncbi:hypothetical protein MNBD_DELTA01-1755 [hydrothermal vent metagenome]|uniref:DUF2304 domain-containing protein n=1 Tax=hydrothermal vent metagenome TaxID=652676 RepID=A0A3B0R4D3_9ZZZZ
MVQLISIIVVIVLFVLVIDFIRRGLLKEKYSVLWLILIAVVGLFAVWRDLLDRVAMLVGVKYPPSLLFLMAFVFVLLILLHFSVVISVLTERNKKLAQEVAIIKDELLEIEKKLLDNKSKES